MQHKPIQIKKLTLSFQHKTCFENFTTQITYGSRIAIIGRNGSGKSSLLKMIQGLLEPSGGEVLIPGDVVFGYVPQVVEDFDAFSGGQRLNKALTQALSLEPNVLLLDEPTNHLDKNNRKSFMRMISAYDETLITVSHDVEFLRNCINTIWHIDNGKILVFSGNYDDYINENNLKRASINQELARIDKQKKETHAQLMHEQQRASKSNERGKKFTAQNKWAQVAAGTKQRQAENTAGRRASAIDSKKSDLQQQLSDLRLPEVILPKFSLSGAEIGNTTLIAISNGSVGYPNQEPLLTNLSFSLGSRERVAIQGLNGSGKSTLIKTILQDPAVDKTGSWHVPRKQDIGYLDQHYGTLCADDTVQETIAQLAPNLYADEVRKHLNDFLFRKNEEVQAPVSSLSGGEKARLSLAQIAIKTPRLLILDEITNNLDLETRQHVIDVLKVYEGAILVISHDEDFLQEIGIQDVYMIENGTLKYQGS